VVSMEKSYLVLTSRYNWKGLTHKEMLNKVSVLKELRIPYEVYLEVEIKKVEHIKVKI